MSESLQGLLLDSAKKLYNPDGNPYTWDEIEAAGLHDFRIHLSQVWAFLDLPEPTPVQLDIALYLQLGPERRIIQAFRGVGKSWITVAFVSWLLFLNPQMKVEVVSASGGLAEDFVRFMKSLLDMDILKHLKPRRGQRDKATVFDVGPARPSKDPSLKAAGIDGQITGSRADVIVADDVEIPKNSFTVHLRDKLANQVKEFDAILKPGGQVIYLGTPQVEESLYPKLYRGRGYGVRIWPAEIPEKPHMYHGNLAPFVQSRIDSGAPKGTPVDPDRFDAVDLEKRRMSYGRAGYALQFMLDTNPSDAERHPLKLSNLMVLELDSEMAPVKLAWGAGRTLQLDLQAGGFEGDHYHSPAWRSDEMAEFTGTVMAIDPSGMGKDETAYAIVRYLHGNLYLVASGGFLDGFGEETLQALAAEAAAHDVNYIVDEVNYGGGMFRRLLMPHVARYKGKAGTFDEEWNGWSRGQKELRIMDTLEPILGSHKLIVDKRVVEKDLLQQETNQQYSLIYQLTRMSRQKGALPHDDRLEALSMACSYWTEKMNRDADREIARHRNKLLEQELRTFKKQVFSVRDRPKGGRHRRYTPR